MIAATADQAEARLTLVLDYGNPDPAGEPSPAPVDEPKAAAAPAIGKRQAILDQAQTGALPTAPDFSQAGDIAALQAFEINSVSSSPKAMACYRDLCVIVITARAQVPA